MKKRIGSPGEGGDSVQDRLLNEVVGHGEEVELQHANTYNCQDCHRGRGIAEPNEGEAYRVLRATNLAHAA